MDSPESKENSSSMKKSPAERMAKALNDLLNFFSLPVLLGTHLAVAFSILLLEPVYQPPPPSLLSTSAFISSALIASSIKPYIALYNGVIFLALFYCIFERQRPEPLQLAIALNLGAVWCDLLVAGSFRDVRVWILLISILHRLFTSLILVRCWYERRRRRLVDKRIRRRSSFESRLRSLEKRNVVSSRREYNIDMIPTPRDHLSSLLFHQLSASLSSSSKRLSKGSQSSVPSSSYFTTLSSFSGDPIRDKQKRKENENSISSTPKISPTNTGAHVSLEMSFP